MRLRRQRQPADVRDAGQVEALFETAIQRLGGVDLWANNAGVAGAGDVGDGSLDELTSTEGLDDKTKQQLVLAFAAGVLVGSFLAKRRS